jgi:hypothetical protein
MFDTSAVIAAPPERVADLLLTARPGPVGPDNGWLVTHSRYARQATLSGGPNRFEVDSGNGRTLTFEIDRERRIVFLQGGWWHRGEYAITSDPAGGTRLSYQISNVARQPIWLVALSHRLFIGYAAKVRIGLQRLAADIETELTPPSTR